MRPTTVFAGIMGLIGIVALVAAARIVGITQPAAMLAVAVLAALVERTSLNLVAGGRASTSLLVALAAGAALGPVAAGVAGLGAGLGSSLFRGRPLSRTVFNCGSLVTCGVVAGSVLELGQQDAAFGNLFLIGAAAAVGHVVLNGTFVSFVVWLDGGRAKAFAVATAVGRLVPPYAAMGSATALLVWQAQPLGVGVTAALCALLLGITPTARSIIGRARPAAERVSDVGSGASPRAA